MVRTSALDALQITHYTTTHPPPPSSTAMITRIPTKKTQRKHVHSDQTTGKFEIWRENGPPSGRTCALDPIQITREMPIPLHN